MSTTTDQNTFEELEFDLNDLRVTIYHGEWTCPKCDAVNEIGEGHVHTVTCLSCGDTFSVK